MPMYTFECECGGKRDLILAIETRNRVIYCDCGKRMHRRTIYKPHVMPDLPGYQCPVTGKWIEGRRAHEENLKRQDCRLIEPGEREAVDRNRAARDKKLDDEIGETVERAIYEMPSSKREQLAAELTSGVTAEVIRTTPDA